MTVYFEAKLNTCPQIKPSGDNANKLRIFLQVARTHGLIKPKMQLIKAGRLHWSWDKGIEGKPAGAMAA